MKGRKLIFLISQPRSGSTLLQAILGSHPDIYTCTEPWIALPFVYALKEEGSEFDFNSLWSKHAIKAFLEENEINKDFYFSALNSFLSSFYQKALNNSGRRLFLDKTPRYYEIASDLVKIFPEAKFIVLYRHPISVLNSILKTWVKENTDILYHYTRDLLVAPKKLTDFAGKHEEGICLMNYEELVKSPKAEIQRVCEYLGITFFEEIINYNSAPNWAFGDKNFRDKKGPDLSSLEAWKNSLGNKRALNFSYYYLMELGPALVKSLGYDFDSTIAHLNKLHPDEADLKTWQTLMPGKFIVSIEEQRQKIKNNLQSNIFRRLIRRLTA